MIKINPRTKIAKQQLNSILTPLFLREKYTENSWSCEDIRSFLSKTYGIQPDNKTIYERIKKANISTRNRKSANQIRAACDYSKTFWSANLQEALDGFLLGDGNIEMSPGAARLTCCVKHKEFAEYLMSFFKIYQPEIKPYRVKDKRVKSGFCDGFSGRTKFHPDLKKQYERWYPNGTKIVPEDVIISPLSMMIWYLGDGSLSNKNHYRGNASFATHCFNNNDKDILRRKMSEYGLNLVKYKSGDSVLNSNDTYTFIQIIGLASPIECYSYKFAIDQSILGLKDSQTIAKELGLSQGIINYHVRVGNLLSLKRYGRNWIEKTELNKWLKKSLLRSR